MSMNATDAAASASATLRATVDLPEPEPPAMPMSSGLAGVIAPKTEWSRRAAPSRGPYRGRGAIFCPTHASPGDDPRGGLGLGLGLRSRRHDCARDRIGHADARRRRHD